MALREYLKQTVTNSLVNVIAAAAAAAVVVLAAAAAVLAHPATTKQYL